MVTNMITQTARLRYQSVFFTASKPLALSATQLKIVLRLALLAFPEIWTDTGIMHHKLNDILAGIEQALPQLEVRLPSDPVSESTR